MSIRHRGRHRKPSVLTLVPTARLGAGVGAVAAVGLMAPASAQAAAPAAASAPSIAPASTSSFSGIVHIGQRGATVKAIQRKVGVSADGVFGPRTLRAVKSFQRSHGLVVDGVVGPRTAAKMGLKGSAKTSKATTKKKSVSRSTRTASRSVTRSATSGGLLGTAASLTGTPYSYGGTSPSGFDCSGFTGYVFKKHGTSLPRTAEAQRRATDRVSSPRAGDLVFFGAPAYHVGIYAGNGQMYDAGRSGSTVTKRAIWTSAVTYGRA